MFGLVRYIDNVLDLENGRRCIQVLINAGADRNAVNNAGKRRSPSLTGTIRSLGAVAQPWLHRLILEVDSAA